MLPELVLLPSPLLGRSVWQPAAKQLRRAGWSATVAAGPAAPSTPDEVLRSYLDSIRTDAEVVLVPHSNAGLYVPRLIAERDVVATVFVDAALPPDAGSVPLAPAGMDEFLAARADEDGLLPPWTQWWEDGDLDGLFPSRAARTLVEREQPRLPLTYFRTTLPVSAGWADTPGAYLAFGDTYADERHQAGEHGWPVRTLPGRHLHMLAEPRQVATAVTDLLASLGLQSSR
ncbi:MAG: hypothetical protein GEU96_07260 [Propionibacteriales bacterium]|nr:hypothetical protein [Propionibacteriales bacterium]